MMTPTLNESFYHKSQDFISFFKEYLGITFSFDNISLSPAFNTLYIVMFTLLFFTSALYFNRRLKNNCYI